MTPPHKQQGIAMITAMMIVAICVTVVTSIFVQQRYGIRLAGNFQDLEQAYQYAYAAEDLAGVLLKRDLVENKHDSAFDNWASKEIKPFEIDDDEGDQIGLMTIEIEDMQGRFNINNLVKKEDGKQRDRLVRVFQNLLQQAGLPTSFSHNMVDWIDADSQPYHNGAESPYYEALPSPYSAANDFLSDPGEMLRVKMGDVTDRKEKEEKLLPIMPFITALPTPTSINVNTAGKDVLLSTGMLPRHADMIISLRQNQAMTSLEMMDQLTGNTLGLDQPTKQLLGVASNYFRLGGEVRLGKSRLFLNSLLFRSPEGDVRVIMRQFSRVPKPKTEKPAFSG